MIKGYTKPKVKRLVVSVEGREKSGKTHFSLGAPSPIKLIDMDTGLESVIEKFEKDKEIDVSSFDYRDATDVKQWERMWLEVKAMYQATLKSKTFKSLVVDTATEMWELVRLARFGKLSEIMPHHYGPVNAEFRDLIKETYKSDKNLILIHKMKREYIDNKATGELTRSGFTDTPYIVQVVLNVWRNEDNQFGLTVKDCRQVAELAGQDFISPMNNFETLAMEIYPNSKERDWA